jgi:hypothetical protein
MSCASCLFDFVELESEASINILCLGRVFLEYLEPLSGLSLAATYLERMDNVYTNICPHQTEPYTRL